MKKLLMIAFAAASLVACSNYLDEFQDEYEDSFVSVDDPENISSDSHGQTPGDGSKLSSAQTDASSSASIFDASSSNAETGASSSSKKDDEHYDCYMNDSACISEIANEFEKTVRLLDSRNNNVYTAIYVGGLDFETANGYSSIFDDSVSFLLMTENLEYEGESVTALDTNGVFFYTYENAEKACPTGWRLPKITPEWFFLLTGDGRKFNIELPDDEKGCYTNGKFYSNQSIFYWAQKEGETSWFVQKNYLANDYDLHEQERCNTFPVRCVKEFGRYADYAGSSSSSDKTKSSSSAKSSSSSVVSSSSAKSSSSSAKSSSSSEKSSSSSVASSSSEVCREYSSQTYAPVTAITFVNEKNYSETMDGIIEDGVYASIGDCFVVSARPDGQSPMSVVVGTGRAWFNHTWTLNDALLPLDVIQSEQVLDRIDAVILEVDANSRTNSIKMRKGIASSKPEKPSLTPEDGKYFHPLAYIRVKANATKIEQSDIENAVGTSACPFVTGVLETVDIDTLLTQWKVEADQLIADIRHQAEQAAGKEIPDGSVSYEKLTSDAVRLRWENVSVPVGNWTDSDTTYANLGYSWRGQVTPSTDAAKIRSTMQPEVIFSPADLASGIFASFAKTDNGKVYIYAMSKPTSTITISTLTCWR